MHNSATFFASNITQSNALPCLPQNRQSIALGKCLTPESDLSKIEVSAQSKKIQVEALLSSS
jgi:hypothetical protein